MKMSLLLRFRDRLIRGRNNAKAYLRETDTDRIRIEGQIATLDDVLDDLDRVIKNNQDRKHDRRNR